MPSIGGGSQSRQRVAPGGAWRTSRGENGCTAAPRAAPDTRRPVVLRCPGPLVALRGLAALYGLSALSLAALLRRCEARVRTEGAVAPGALATAVGDALGSQAPTPVAVHYYRAAWLLEPERVCRHGLQPSRNGRPLHGAGATDRGPHGELVCDVLLRPALYGAPDHLRAPPPDEDLAASFATSLGADLAQRPAPARTPCIVEYRRRPAHGGRAVDAALWFVAAALRGAVSPQVTACRDARRTVIAAPDIVSVRALATHAEWTPLHR